MDSRGKPPLHLAQLLVGQDLLTVHRYFPVIDEMSVLRKFWSAYDVTSDPAPAKPQWLIIINLLFAI
ncbi:hypothetical protein N7508_007419 [Penicillium antarcticum]|uniref:uncharacterized protein n=1 Tax=Penicillium antarcticum TaxID=416450 RepID=UPI0023A280C1|nr:uncharacterized protein N7508_007419 [Penicillium antarcticum]KAJ5300176.1 hypothetical protein N7508_007419 [Penicillium antarcticum]